MIVKINDLLDIYNNEILKGVKNRKKILAFEKYKIEYLVYIKYILENNLYIKSNYNIFLVKDPKIRVVMSESIIDKVINHYVAKYILISKLSKYLCKEITAARKGMGLTYAINLLLSDIEKLKHKSNNIYALKIDIKKGIRKNIYKYQNNMITFEKYFYSIQNYKHSYNFVNKDKLKHVINRYY